MAMIAAIDIGTNAMRMVIGNVKQGRPSELLENIREPVRLGHDVFSKGSISEENTGKAIEALLKFKKLIEKYNVEKVKAVATSATREALNSDLFIDRITQQTGIDIIPIGSEEEARLIYLAVQGRINLKKKRTLLIDIGGGSVEVTLIYDENIMETESFNMGTVRLLHKLGQQKVEEHYFNKLVREYADATRNWLKAKIGPQKIDLCIGTGGNVEALGELRKRCLGKVSQFTMTASELAILADRLQNMTFQQRMQELDLRHDRADVIVPAAIVLQTIMRQVEVERLLIPHVGLKDGVLLDTAEELFDAKHRLHRDQVLASAMQVGRKYAFDEQHATTVAQFAVQLFDATRSLHNLDAESSLLLEAAALLHDIGHFVNATEHHKHTYYLLTATPLIGLSKLQRAIVANIARYHRKSFPSLQHESYAVLSGKDRVIVSKLAALLRLADGMDTEHGGKVTSFTVEYDRPQFQLQLRGQGDLLLEKWALVKRSMLFEEVFGVTVSIVD